MVKPSIVALKTVQADTEPLQTIAIETKAVKIILLIFY